MAIVKGTKVRGEYNQGLVPPTAGLVPPPVSPSSPSLKRGEIDMELERLKDTTAGVLGMAENLRTRLGPVLRANDTDRPDDITPPSARTNLTTIGGLIQDIQAGVHHAGDVLNDIFNRLEL